MTVMLWTVALLNIAVVASFSRLKNGPSEDLHRNKSVSGSDHTNFPLVNHSMKNSKNPISQSSINNIRQEKYQLNMDFKHSYR